MSRVGVDDENLYLWKQYSCMEFTNWRVF